MKVVAVNGSPRKEWNTAMLLQSALEGAASKGAETELVHLYDLDYKGCKSCFACKAKDGRSYGHCAVRDDLTPLIEKLDAADAVFLGSPIYLGSVTGEMQSFIERWVFPYFTYTDPPSSIAPKKKPIGIIYAMGATDAMVKAYGYEQHFAIAERLLGIVFGHAETMMSLDNYQFADYSRVVAPRFDPEAKLTRRQEVFPKDRERAYQTGARLATPIPL